nr:hypothetical protein [uncultured Holophaga sp.]
MRGVLPIPVLIGLVAMPLGAATHKMSDADAEALARQALASHDKAVQRQALERLEHYFFQRLHSSQREFVLFAMGTLFAREGDVAKAVVQFRKLERTWPQSVYLPEAQVTLGEDAIDHGKLKDGERRLREVLGSDLPVESKRRAQELLLWSLAEQGRASEGLPIVESLFPVGTDKPSERGLTAIAETLAAAGQQDGMESTLRSLQRHYPKSPYLSRVQLARGRMLGQLGHTLSAAEVFRKLIQANPKAPEADEARLALATILSEGKLNAREAKAFPDAGALLAEMKGKPLGAAKSQLVRLRLAISNSKWVEALDLAGKIRQEHPDAGDAMATTELRAQAFRALAQTALDGHRLDDLLGRLDPEGVQCLSADQRKALVVELARQGLPGAARTVSGLAPTAEREGLHRLILASTLPEAHPHEVLGLLKGRRESPADALRRARALAASEQWKELPPALARATPGADRMAALMAYLRRPQKGAPVAARRREAESWLARSRERGADREPLVLLVADLGVQAGDWRGALTRYPSNPQPQNRGWVSLMRATCLARLGRKDEARALLKAAQAEQGFKMERQRLSSELGL